jgi:hypothetical protein
MKGILVHSTTDYNLVSILEDKALYDSSKTDPEFDEGDAYKDILANKIFFQLVFEPIHITGIYKEERGFSNNCLLFFDSSMIEEYGHKRYVKNEGQERVLKRLSEEKRKTYLENEIPKTKVWFNINWYHGGFHVKSSRNEEYSFNYNPKTTLEENIQHFYDAKLREIKNTTEEDYEDNLEAYQEALDDKEYEMTEESKKSWEEKLSSEFPKTFTRKAKNEVVFQAQRISLKETKKSPHLLAIYIYKKSSRFVKNIEKDFPEYRFLKTPEELQEFIREYYED